MPRRVAQEASSGAPFRRDLSSPLTHFYIANNCVDYPGWSCDARMTDLLARFPRAADDGERRRLADEVSKVAYETVPAVMWGQLAQPAAYRAALRDVIPSAVPVFWNLAK